MFAANNRTMSCIFLFVSEYAGCFCSWNHVQVGFSAAGFAGD